MSNLDKASNNLLSTRVLAEMFLFCDTEYAIVVAA